MYEFYVFDQNVFSDHVPILFKLVDINIGKYDLSDYVFDSQNTLNTSPSYFFKWNKDFCDLFYSNMNEQNTINGQNTIIESLDKDADVIDAEKCLNDLNIILETVTQPFLKTISTSANNTYKKSKNSWYDSDCKAKKKEFEVAKTIFLQSQDNNDLIFLTNTRNTYRKICRRKKNQYKQNSAYNLLKMSRTNSKIFWQNIKRKSFNPTPNCEFDVHFKNLQLLLQISVI